MSGFAKLTIQKLDAIVFINNQNEMISASQELQELASFMLLNTSKVDEITVSRFFKLLEEQEADSFSFIAYTKEQTIIKKKKDVGKKLYMYDVMGDGFNPYINGIPNLKLAKRIAMHTQNTAYKDSSVRICVNQYKITLNELNEPSWELSHLKSLVFNKKLCLWMTGWGLPEIAKKYELERVEPETLANWTAERRKQDHIIDAPVNNTTYNNGIVKCTINKIKSLFSN